MTELARNCYRKFERYIALASELENQLPGDDGWSVVIRFYAALHLMNCYLVGKGIIHFEIASANHEDRRRIMERCPELRDAPKKYRDLIRPE